MTDFGDYLHQVVSDLEVLSNDIKKMASEKAKKEKGKNFKDISLKSLQPTVKMYQTKEEIVASKKSPEEDFIRAQLEKIFSS